VTLERPVPRTKGPQSDEQASSPASQMRFPQQFSFIVLIHNPSTHVSVVQLTPSSQSVSRLQGVELGWDDVVSEGELDMDGMSDGENDGAEEGTATVGDSRRE